MSALMCLTIDLHHRDIIDVKGKLQQYITGKTYISNVSLDVSYNIITLTLKEPGPIASEFCLNFPQFWY